MARILLTGGAGYVGSHCAKALAAAGHEGIVFDSLLFGHRDLVRWGKLIKGDIRDAAALNALFAAYRIDAVMHFAALAYVGESVQATPETHTFTEQQRKFWAFQRVMKPSVPGGAPNPIDAFLTAKLAAQNIKPNPRADRITLLRRVYFDLTGLPPSPEDVDAFVQSKDPDAYEKLIDKLLASPQYGEKWGRHWLDVVRFAETNGYERDGPKPYAWR